MHDGMLGLYKYIAHRLSVGYKWEGKWHINHLWQLGGTLLGHIHCPRIYPTIHSQTYHRNISHSFLSARQIHCPRHHNIIQHIIEMHQTYLWQLGGTLSWDTYIVPKYSTIILVIGIYIGI